MGGGPFANLIYKEVIKLAIYYKLLRGKWIGIEIIKMYKFFIYFFQIWISQNNKLYKKGVRSKFNWKKNLCKKTKPGGASLSGI